MKGPFERVKYDLRRVWECPLCKQRQRTEGSVTAQFCNCRRQESAGEPVAMRLIADGPRRIY